MSSPKYYTAQSVANLLIKHTNFKPLPDKLGPLNVAQR